MVTLMANLVGDPVASGSRLVTAGSCRQLGPVTKRCRGQIASSRWRRADPAGEQVLSPVLVTGDQDAEQKTGAR
jgi:hypothetical protein